MDVGTIMGIIFRIVANLPAIMEAVNKILALYPDLRKILSNILPGVLTALPAADAATSNGFSVEWLQESLNKLDGAGLTVDGDYGTLTRDAVKAFQTKRGMDVDGWAGTETSAKIYDEIAKKPA